MWIPSTERFMTLIGCMCAGTDFGFAHVHVSVDWWNPSHKYCGNLSFPACCMTLDDILLQPAHLTVVAWPMSEHSDTLVSSLFWLPPAACWSWCVFQPWCVSLCAMLNRLQLCVTSIPFATPKSKASQARTCSSSPVPLIALSYNCTHIPQLELELLCV